MGGDEVEFLRDMSNNTDLVAMVQGSLELFGVLSGSVGRDRFNETLTDPRQGDGVVVKWPELVNRPSQLFPNVYFPPFAMIHLLILPCTRFAMDDCVKRAIPLRIKQEIRDFD